MAEKYIKVKLSTSGKLDISGVIGLIDCEHVPWKHGSMEYLRSLNTGNQKYLFKLSMPFNDIHSVLWWKPDEPEQLEVEEEEEGEIEEETGYRYFKPYETERFLRWFGSNYVPLLDLDTITKKTICSAPMLSNETESVKFYKDATNIANRNADLTKINIDDSTSIPLLSLAKKASINVVNLLDQEHQGQYLELVVSGHQQTSNISFHISGKMYNSIQEMNHFANTYQMLLDTYRAIGKEILFIDITKTIYPAVETVWKKINPNKQLIPDDWKKLFGMFERLQ